MKSKQERNVVISLRVGRPRSYAPFCLYTVILLVMMMNKSDPGEIQKGSGNVVQHVVYRVPKRNHDSMLRLCQEANDLFRKSGGLHHEVFQLSNTDVPAGAFASIASILSADKDEEVWMELLHFKDRQHMKEVIAKMEKDEKYQRAVSKSLDLATPGAVFIIGEFDRLTG